MNAVITNWLICRVQNIDQFILKPTCCETANEALSSVGAIGIHVVLVLWGDGLMTTLVVSLMLTLLIK